MPDPYDPPSSQLITLAAAGNLLGLTRSALLKAAASGTLWTIKPGSQHYTTQEQAEHYREDHANYRQSERMKSVIRRREERP